MKNQTNNLALPKTSNTASNPDAAQSSKPVMNAVNTSYFVADQPSSSGTVTKIEQEKKQDRKVWSILSIIATTIPIILWGLLFYSFWWQRKRKCVFRHIFRAKLTQKSTLKLQST